MGVAAKKKSHSKGLGRGLDALLGDAPSARASGRTGETAPAPGPRRELPIEFLKPNPDQPRRQFDDEAIAELAGSIKTRGLLQPILVRPMGRDDYQIVAGERRWRAAQKAKLHDVPVIIRELTDEETAEIALIENVQRVDLNPIEEAEAYHRLVEAYGRTQEEVAKAVGKSRSHVANMLRLLGLPAPALNALSAGKITMGHARALLGLDDPAAALKAVLAKGLSVRETEAFAREQRAPEKPDVAPKSSGKTSPSKGASDSDTRALERDLAAILGLDVAIAHSKKGSGSVTVNYLNLDQLDDICRRLMGSSA